MDRRDLLRVVGGAGLLAVAGCASDSSNRSPEESPGSANGGNAGGQGTPTDDVSLPPGVSSEGIEDREAVVSAQRDFLMSSSSYTGEWVLETIDQDGETRGQPTEATTASDTEARTVHLQYLDHANDVEVFYDGTFYEYNAASDRVIEGESNRLFTDLEKQFEPISLWAVDTLLARTLESIVVDSGTRTEVRGRPGLRFDVVDVSDAVAEEYDDITFTGASGGVAITDRGLRELGFVPEFESEGTSFQTVTYAVDGVGSTSVDRPTWLD